MRVFMFVIFAVVLWSSCAQTAQRRFKLPGLVLWAWQRPEDLTFIDTHTTGVAYLAGTARTTGSGFPVFEPRLQPLALAPGTPLLAVVRIESRAPHTALEKAMLLESFRKIADVSGVRGLQIDFDARASERPFYRSLLTALHSQSATPVGVTALASWCSGDRWLDRAPIAEAVPMFFRMGRGESREMQINSAVCGSSIGLSIDEAWPVHRPAGLERVYLFNPRAWTRVAYRSAQQRLGDWK